MLISYSGDRKSVNRKLLLESFESTPSLILDCGNAADVHSLFGKIDEELLHKVYVINLEAIYRFRKGLELTPKFVKELGIKQIIVTTISILFSYDDEVENFNILEHCWEIMKEISRKTPIKVGIGNDKLHYNFSNRFADKMCEVDKIKINHYHSPRYLRH
jgi:hypothetical protein